MSSERKVPGVECQLQVTLCVVVLVTAALHTWYTTEWSVCMSGRAPIQSGRCWFVCPAELQYNQADVGLFVRPRSNTIRQMSVCMSGRAHIQSGTRGFESLAGSVLEEDQYNQAYELMNELHTIKQDRYITCSQKPVMKEKKFYVIK